MRHPNNLYKDVCQRERKRARKKYWQSLDIHISHSVWPARLVYFIATLCAGGTRWQLSSFSGKYGASLVFSFSLCRFCSRLSFFILLCHLTISFSPSQLLLLSFLWLPSVLLPCMLLFAIYPCRFARIPPSSRSPFPSSSALCHFLGYSTGFFSTCCSSFPAYYLTLYSYHKIEAFW